MHLKNYAYDINQVKMAICFGPFISATFTDDSKTRECHSIVSQTAAFAFASVFKAPVKLRACF